MSQSPSSDQALARLEARMADLLERLAGGADPADLQRDLAATAAEMGALVRAQTALAAERTAHLESAAEEIRGFVFLFSHDLRTPLVTIRGFAAELADMVARLEGRLQQAASFREDEDLRRLVGEEVPEALGHLTRAAAEVDRLGNAMLTLSHMGRRPLTFQAVDSAAVWAHLLTERDARLRALGAAVSSADLPVITADREAFRHIVAQLLDNALAALASAHGREIRFTYTAGADHEVFHLADSGRGVAAEDVPRIFEPFGKADQPGAQGLGMGLVYAKTLVRRHGGKLWCAPTPGGGTTFSFTLARQPRSG